MKDWWTHAKSWLLIAAAVGLSILVLVLRSLMMKKGTPQEPGFAGLPPAPAALQAVADDAYEASITVKANAKATNEASKVQLAEISKMEDRKARRAALASFVKNP